MEGKPESHCPRTIRGSIRLNRWTDPLRRPCVYLANHTSKLRRRQRLPTERVGPLCGGKKTLKKSLLKPQNKSPLVNECFPPQEHLIEESDVEIQDRQADLEKQCTSTSVFMRSSNPSCANKCKEVHGVENFPIVEDTGLKACRFGNEAQLHQYETSRGLATTGKRSDMYGRASLEEQLLKLHVPEDNVRGTERLGRARREQNIPKLKKTPVPTLAIFKTNREGQFEKNDFPTLPVTVYKRSDKFGRGSLENIERTKISDHASAEERVAYGKKTRTPIVSVFKRSDRHGWASLEEKAHRCLNSPKDNLKGGTVRHHQASIEGKGQVKKPLSPAFRIFKRSNRHGGANVEKIAHRSQELRLPKNNVHETSRCWRACPEEQITLQEKPRELTSTVFKRSDKNGPAIDIEERVYQLHKSSVNVERAGKHVIELVKPSPSATTLEKPYLQKRILHSGNECAAKKMPQLVKLRAPTAVFSLSNRCGRARLEEHGPEFVKPDTHYAQRTNTFRQTCTELKPNKSDDRSLCRTSQQQCVHTAKQEECASTTEHDNDASHRLKTSKKLRRLWKRKRNQIVPMFIPATKRGNRIDTYASPTATAKSFITECKRKGHLNEVARNNRDKTCRYPRADTATISAEPVINSYGEHNVVDSHPQAPKAPNEAKGDKRLLPRTKFNRRPLQSIPRKGSDLAVHCLNQIHQQIDAPYPYIVEPGKMVKIPLSVTKGTRQLSCRVYRPEDFEQVIAHDGERVQLGEGSFGNVTLVTMRSTDHPLVAVKSFHGSRVRERDVFREVEAMQEAQDHWAFPKLHGVIKNRQALGIALEFIGDSTALMGQTLQHAIRHKKKMKVKHNWISIANDIAHGLNHLHGKGFLHCDLKSNNALLWKDGGVWRAKIIDLGKACRIENARGPMTRLTEAKQQDNFARFPHLPHEVIVGQGGYTVEGDIYSLGYVFRQISTVCSHNNHRMIELATRCYDVEPSCRPTLPRVIQELTSWCVNGHRWWVT